MLQLRRSGRALADDGPAVSPDDVTTTPIFVRRGFVAVPTPDVQEYVRSQALTFAGGFVVGMGIGALFGNLLTRRAR